MLPALPLRVALLATALLVAPASAGDPLAAAFKQASKAAVKDVKVQSAIVLKAAKVELAAAADDYGDGTADAATAMAAALDAMTFYRDVLADSARDAVSQLAADGVALLTEAGATEAGPDFQAGGRGTWDDALLAVEKALDKADSKFTAAFARFVKDMGKGAAKQDAVIDIRWRVPEHGDEIWSILPPLLADGALAVAEAIEVAPPQVLIEARFVETGTAEQLGIGARFNESSADVIVSSGVGESLELGALLAGAGDTDSGNFALAGLQHPSSFVSVSVTGTSDRSNLEALSAPRITGTLLASNPAIQADFKQDLKDGKLAAATACADALALLGKNLDSHVAAVSQGLATADVALVTGLLNLRDAREAMAAALQQARAGAVSQLQVALDLSGFDDDDLLPDFAPDAVGLYRDTADAQAAKLAKCQDKASRRYRAFVDKILGLAKKKDQLVGANAVVGRTHALAPPMVTTAGAPPEQEVSPTRLTDGLVLRVTPVIGPDEFSVMLVVQTDPTEHPLVNLSATTLLDADTLDLGQVSAGAGGTAKSNEVPLLGELPLLGWIFRGKADSEPNEGLMIIIKPDIVGGE